MRARVDRQQTMVVALEQLVPADHPLRRVKLLARRCAQVRWAAIIQPTDALPEVRPMGTTSEWPVQATCRRRTNRPFCEPGDTASSRSLPSVLRGATR
jgi:hypothetical protein